MTNAVLTGQVHVGKTTVCRKVADWAQQRGRRVRGILTLPIFDDDGSRLGIEALDLASGQQRELARVDRDWGGPCMGPYHFDPAALRWGEDLVEQAIAGGCDLLVVDEIGRLELEMDSGFRRVLPLLANNTLPRSLLVVRATLLEALRTRVPTLQFVAFEVTQGNRDVLPLEVLRRLFLV
jgi:nucleoside-triphosphatase THEP1